MLSPANVFILGFIGSCPVNPYEIVSRIEYNRYKDLFHIADSTIYANIRALNKKGYIDYDVQQDGVMPAKKVYNLTDSGLEELKNSIRYYLSTYSSDLTGFSVSLLMMHYFSKEELISFLEMHKAAMDPILCERQKEFKFVSEVNKDIPCIPNVASSCQVFTFIEAEYETTCYTLKMLNETTTWPQNTFLSTSDYAARWKEEFRTESKIPTKS